MLMKLWTFGKIKQHVHDTSVTSNLLGPIGIVLVKCKRVLAIYSDYLKNYIAYFYQDMIGKLRREDRKGSQSERGRGMKEKARRSERKW